MLQTRKSSFIFLLAFLLGCQAIQDIAKPFKDDPAYSILKVVKEQILAIRTEVFIPLDLESSQGLCDEFRCETWRQVDAGITALHNSTIEVLDGLETGQERIRLARGVAENFIRELQGLQMLDFENTQYYEASILALKLAIETFGIFEDSSSNSEQFRIVGKRGEV
jgi:hypothetical protein